MMLVDAKWGSLSERLSRIELLILDVDGVMTKGEVIYSGETEVKSFHVRDGSGIRLWQMAGKKVALISGRNSPATHKRATELGIHPIIQGASDKRPGFFNVLEVTGCTEEQTCVMGDDLPDVPLLMAANWGVAVANACDEAKQRADWVTEAMGGHGAIRELIEYLLKSQGKWDELIAPYLQPVLRDPHA